ncbi:mep operon protein MepB [Bacillus wiedmannii]|uniref:MepB family protein n=1 Tax=Bacillus wiedmannii TaxID=1890302 RepID=UPI000BEF4ED5|nr:MepB family protein [Bacillus wiedmannii]PEI74035.1 mep operon protein MepB [Bacillus wiedmannii]PEN62640.1 mep operon protein MepB [Bacillus wiedmannii]PEO74910.1 mep operon protein MepB [Bacillus wiedmannii]PFX61394.1 mep operon protein MepB [Bacillus wiedmannii]PFZ65924.1 mep operon protein MepB [Bacillus wiedmannii]
MNKGGIFLNKFNDVIRNLNNIIYKPNELIITNLKEEQQNAEYAGCLFNLNNKTIRFRVSKITPNKTGQFVSFWEKDDNMQNQAFSYDAAPDLLVITCIDDNKLGQFIFPKEILLKEKILKMQSQKGKMAMRIYPIWDIPVSNQAKKSQMWQLQYFVDLSDHNNLSLDKLLNLYL